MLLRVVLAAVQGYGAFGLPFGKKIEDPEKKAKSLTAEINNGRLAMVAIIGPGAGKVCSRRPFLGDHAGIP